MTAYSYLLSSNFGFSKRVMWVSVLVSDCHPELEKPKLDDNIRLTPIDDHIYCLKIMNGQAIEAIIISQPFDFHTK